MSAPVVCPTCGGDGSEARMFDGHCPAAWAHFVVGNRWLWREEAYCEIIATRLAQNVLDFGGAA